MATFFDLARELRDMIYAHYVSTPDGQGYVFNPQTGKLKLAAKGELIDLSLAYTCKQIAHEMRGVALATNTVTFLPWLSDNTTPARFHFLRNTMDKIEDGMLYISNTVIRRTPQLQPLLAEKYPNFLLALQEATRTDQGIIKERTARPFERDLLKLRRNGWGEIPSIHCDAVQFTLRKLASDPTWETEVLPQWRRTFREAGAEDCLNLMVKREDIPRPCNVVQLCLSTPYWSLPTAHNVDEMAATLKRRTLEHTAEFWETVTGNYHFSAAAVAISFLESLPKETRLQLRRLLLHETQQAVAFPQCHARGLIPYCQENPTLRIERRLDMWTNVLRGEILEYYNRLLVDDVSYRVGSWLVESMALVPAGMPPQCFSMVLDGGPLPDKCSDLFEVLHRDAAWQLAWESRVACGSVVSDLITFPQSDRDVRYGPNSDLSSNSDYSEYTSDDSEYADADLDSRWQPANYEKYAEWDSFINLADILSYYFGRLAPMNVFDQFPHVVRNVVNKSSLVRCNFNTGYDWDPQQVVEMAEREHWDTDWIWMKAWTGRRPDGFPEITTLPPLPSWAELMKEGKDLCNSWSRRHRQIMDKNKKILKDRRKGKPNNCHMFRKLGRGVARRREMSANVPEQQADSSLPARPAEQTHNDPFVHSDSSSD